MTKFFVAAVLGALVVALAGCGGDEETAPVAGTTGGAPEAAFDRAFIDAMVPHHRSAIAMAKAAQGRGLTQPDLERIAADIVVSQQREIDKLLEWRESWFGSRELDPEGAAKLGVPEAEGGMMEHGPDQILEAVDVDGTFAKLMIPHHEAAVAMAEAARARSARPELKELAEQIISAQEREIGIMRKHAGGAMNHG